MPGILGTAALMGLFWVGLVVLVVWLVGVLFPRPVPPLATEDRRGDAVQILVRRSMCAES